MIKYITILESINIRISRVLLFFNALSSPLYQFGW